MTSIDDCKTSHVGGDDELLQLVSFNIGKEECGADILKVQEIDRMQNVTRVPNAPEYVDRVINFRGKVLRLSIFGVGWDCREKTTTSAHELSWSSVVER